MKKKYILLVVFILAAKSIFAQDQFVGEIRLFPFNFAPKGWAKCEGQLLPISQNTALFSLLGTTYGGNGTTNFALPDLRDRMAIGAGQGPGLSTIALGQSDGSTTSTLVTANLPAHTHSVDIKASSSVGNTSVPSATTSLAAPVQLFNSASRPITEYNVTPPDVTLSNITTATTGNSTPMNKEQPIQSSIYCIALQGIYPPRN
nr:tail fiber protein [uncultured Flavobacterium sp.]